MRKLTTKEAIDNLIRVLLHSGKPTHSESWQAVDATKFKMIEVCDLFVKMEMTDEDLEVQTGADMPWAEDHFKERLRGPSNPGEQYKNWPYWDVDTRFLLEGGKFSHTYQERFWPRVNGDGYGRLKGIRYHVGNWKDIKHRLSKDPSSRQAFLAIWHPEDQSNNGVRVPCTIGYWFKINNNRLDVTYLIRSCDARRHLRNDVYMAQRLAMDMLKGLWLEGHYEIELGNMNMWIGSLHCFESDIYELKKQMK